MRTGFLLLRNTNASLMSLGAPKIVSQGEGEPVSEGGVISDHHHPLRLQAQVEEEEEAAVGEEPISHLLQSQEIWTRNLG